MSNRIWFITGASRGFGRSFAQAALRAGDRVAATARDTSSLDEESAEYGDALLPIELDVELLEAYQEIDQIAERRAFQREDNNGSQPGNPDLAARALLETLDRDDPPFRLLLGNVAYDVAVDRYENRLNEFRAGEAVARSADDR
jgi:NAD(P)-dependent dehydrogenase (short-subunit alcohol dehydrogenase family)